MPNCDGDINRGRRSLEILEEQFASGADTLSEAQIDDRGGRVTGKWECTICGMHYDIYDIAADCCFPLFIALGVPISPTLEMDARQTRDKKRRWLL